MELDDGTIVPHWMGITDSTPSGAQMSMNDPFLRVGRVINSHWPGEAGNPHGTGVVYDVEVDYINRGGTHTRQVYSRARVMSAFGGVADSINYTPRPKESGTNELETGINTGSMVLLLCINGNTRQAIIISGLRHSQLAKDSKEDGHNLKFKFNGIEFTINKDGELNLGFGGATKSDGSLSDAAKADAGGAFLNINREGTIVLATGPDKTQSITLDHVDKSVRVWAQTNLSLQGLDGEVNVGAKTDVNISAPLAVNINGDENVVINSEKGDVVIAGSPPPGFGVILGSGSDMMLKASTYRTQETVMNSQVSTMLMTSGGLITGAGAVLAVASIFHLIPVAGPIIAAPLIMAASVMLTTSGPLLITAGAAIATFEAQSPLYLSLKNKND